MEASIVPIQGPSAARLTRNDQIDEAIVDRFMRKLGEIDKPYYSLQGW